MEIYNAISCRVAGEQTIGAAKGTVQQGTTSIENALIDSSVMGTTNLTMNMYFDRDHYSVGEPIKVSVSLTDAIQPITEASVIADIELSPTASTSLKNLAGKDNLTEEENHLWQYFPIIIKYLCKTTYRGDIRHHLLFSLSNTSSYKICCLAPFYNHPITQIFTRKRIIMTWF